MRELLKKFLPKGLYWRTFLIIAIPLVLVELVTAYVVYDRHMGSVNKTLSQLIADEIALCSSVAAKNPYQVQDVTSRLDIGYAFHLHQKLPIFKEKLVLPWIDHTFRKTLDEHIPYDFQLRTTDSLIKIAVQVPIGVAVFSLPHKRLYSRTTPLVFLGTLGSTIVFMALALIFMRNQMRPIRRLAIAAEKFGRGQKLKNFKPEGAVEVRRAATAFINMQQRIQRYLQQRTDMLAAISHDLRTPLTRMKLQLAMESNLQSKKDLEEDIGQMEQLIQEYLDFVRDEGEEEYTTIHPERFLQDLLKPFRRTGAKIKLQKNVQEFPSFSTKPFALSRALSNLIQNALKYGTELLITLDRTQEELVISIEDNGPGVPEDELANIFQPFYRVDKSRNADTGGAGLGLTIARDIIIRFGGKIELSSGRILKGLRVECFLPLN